MVENIGFLADHGARATARAVKQSLRTTIQRFGTGPLARMRNSRKVERYLELGPGKNRIPDFETLNVVGGRQVDYVGDATKRLPFRDNTFDIVYASHILEHVAWYSAATVVSEWARILKPGGTIEIWVPDGLKIAQAFVDAETTGSRAFEQDGWWRFNEAKDPCLWMSGRAFSYGDGTGQRGHFNWHLATYSGRRLSDLLTAAGLTNVRQMTNDEVRGYDHGWINLGVAGTKPGRTNA